MSTNQNRITAYSVRLGLGALLLVDRARAVFADHTYRHQEPCGGAENCSPAATIGILAVALVVCCGCFNICCRKPREEEEEANVQIRPADRGFRQAIANATNNVLRQGRSRGRGVRPDDGEYMLYFVQGESGCVPPRRQQTFRFSFKPNRENTCWNVFAWNPHDGAKLQGLCANGHAIFTAAALPRTTPQGVGAFYCTGVFRGGKFTGHWYQPSGASGSAHSGPWPDAASLLMVVASKETRDTVAGITFANPTNEPIYIRRMAADSIFQGTSLKEGYQIVSINNIAMKGKEAQDAANVLKDAVGCVTILAKARVFTSTPLALQVGAFQSTTPLVVAAAWKDITGTTTGVTIGSASNENCTVALLAPNSQFKETGLEEGDTILAVNNMAVQSRQEAANAIKNAEGYVTILAFRASLTAAPKAPDTDPNSVAPADVFVNNEGRDFPAAFYDPITGKLMRDPYVDPVGVSYDKSTLQKKGTFLSSCFPNRALKQIIEQEVDAADQSWRGSVRSVRRAIHSGWGRLAEKTHLGSHYRPLPDSFYCPITAELMEDPVIAKDGTSYEREALEHWIRSHGKSPITRESMTIDELRENKALYALIQNEKGRAAESIHPSVRRWKGPPAGDDTTTLDIEMGGQSKDEYRL